MSSAGAALRHGEVAEDEPGIGRGVHQGHDGAGVVEVLVGQEDPAQLVEVDLSTQGVDERRRFRHDARVDEHGLAGLDQVGVDRQEPEIAGEFVVGQDDQVTSCTV